MLVTTAPMADLVEEGRWKVEFFGPGRSARNGRYPIVRLGTILRERRETLDPQHFPDHIFHYLGLEHVQSVSGDLVDHRPRAGLTVLSRSKVFRTGDILYGRLRPALNKVFVADERAPEGICSGEFFVLSPDVERIRPHVARALLASRFVQEVVAGLTTGTALPRLHRDDLLAIEVPLPPLAEQEAIERYFVDQQRRRAQLARELVLQPSLALESLEWFLEERGGFRPPSVPDPEATHPARCQLPSNRRVKTEKKRPASS